MTNIEIELPKDDMNTLIIQAHRYYWEKLKFNNKLICKAYNKTFSFKEKLHLFYKKCFAREKIYPTSFDDKVLNYYINVLIRRRIDDENMKCKVCKKHRAQIYGECYDCCH